MEYEEIVEALKPMIEWNDFAHSLLLQYQRKGELSERQWDAAEAERIYERCRENLEWLNLPARPANAKSAKHHSRP